MLNDWQPHFPRFVDGPPKNIPRNAHARHLVPFRTLLIGMSNSGKTHALGRLYAKHLKGKFDMILAFSSTHRYTQNLGFMSKDPGVTILQDYFPQALIDLEKKQLKRIKEGKRRWAILTVFDDIDPSKTVNCEVVNRLWTRGRNLGFSVAHLVQKLTMSSRTARAQATLIMMWDTGGGERESIKKAYLNSVLSPKDWQYKLSFKMLARAIFDSTWEKRYQCLVVDIRNGRGTSTFSMLTQWLAD